MFVNITTPRFKNISYPKELLVIIERENSHEIFKV